MAGRSVLISGAGIAGPAMAYWLARYGWQPTVVERSPTLRTTGQNVDVRGAGREVARRTGVEELIRAATTGEEGTRFVDVHDRVHGSFPASTSDTGGATAELEILRGDLTRILVERSAAGSEYVYGDRITALDDTGDGVTVSFEKGTVRRFDLVVVADGIYSGTRRLVFGEEVQIRPLNMYVAYFTLAREESDERWARWCTAPGGRAMTLRPDNEGTTRATMSFLSLPRGYDRLTVAEQKGILHDRFAGVGWQAPRLLAALDSADDLYFEFLGQVRAPRWSSGRVALLGDAAYCASPISGMGTSLALVGAYVLAGELATHPDHREALRSYERIVRPYVEQAQKLPPGAPRVANPMSKAGLAVFHGALRVVSQPAFTWLGEKLFTPPADKIDLPDYSSFVVAA
jgi:2-polyprenyl-6-methoxyphenol hydroxylase-like FAD-dependent oxidoreductase